MSQPRKLYVLVCDKTGDWIAQCIEKGKISSHSPDAHLEIWYYNNFNDVVQKERIEDGQITNNKV